MQTEKSRFTKPKKKMDKYDRAVEKAGDKLCPACMQRNKNLAQNMRSYVNKDNRKWDRDIERDCNEKKRHDGAC